jgi:predicted acyl esterase
LATPEPLEPARFYDYEIAIAPTAYRLPAGHRLQLRLTSYNVPNALPGTIDFNGSAPATSSFVPLPPATNTLRYGGTDGSSLVIPVSTGP